MSQPGTSTSETKDEDKALSPLTEWFTCPESDCDLNIGMILPTSSYADVKATSVIDLAEKAYVAGSVKWSAEEKDKILLEDKPYSEEFIMDIPKLILHAAWKAVLGKCAHRRNVFMENLGKSLNGKEIVNVEMVHHMTAFVAGAKFLQSAKSDTVVVGGENACNFAKATGAQHWSLLGKEDYLLRSHVIFGAAIKKMIYIPNGDLFYNCDSSFEEAVKILLESLKVLVQCNDVQVIMLPLFRHCGFPDVNQNFITWFKEQEKANENDKIKWHGNEELDEKRLINWLEATPRDATKLNYVNFHGILSKNGLEQLGEYLNQLDYSFKINTQSVMEKKHVSNACGQNESACENDSNLQSSSVNATRGHRQPFKPRQNSQIRQNSKPRSHQNESDCQNGAPLPYRRGRNSNSRGSNRNAPYNQNRGQRNFRGRKI